MRALIITTIVLIFSLQSWTKADDISDFQIEGISIGDSLLDIFTKNENCPKYPPDDFPPIRIFRSFFLAYCFPPD